MNAEEIVAALDLPAGARVDQRIPKKLLLENGAATAADKRFINDGIEEISWLAALKPNTVGVPEYRDNLREYLEVAVLQLTLRAGAKSGRLVELVHRAVPYPVLLLTIEIASFSVSAANKRWSQGESGVTVLDGDVVIAESSNVRDVGVWTVFRDALALGKQPRDTIYALYQGWVNTLLALQAASVTGTFAAPATHEQASARREALQEYARLDNEITRLRAAATKEKQVPRRVELNLELKRVEAAQAAARAKL